MAFILVVSEIKAVSALLGISGVALYRGCTTRTKTTRGQTFKALSDPILVSVTNSFHLFVTTGIEKSTLKLSKSPFTLSISVNAAMH